MKRARFVLAPIFVLLAAAQAIAQALPAATAEELGLSSARLERLNAVVRQYVDAGQVGGVVTLVVRGGRVANLEAFGKLDVEKSVPMRKDAIFRIASMSKGLTSLAAVILMEEGKLRLADPVSRYLPAFRQTTVGVAGPAGSGRFGSVPARRAITIRDLLTHTAGISYGTGVASDQYKAAGLQGWYLSDKNEPIVPLMERLPALPFDAQPGEQFVYGYNTDILGAVIEKASGMRLDEFMRARIFEPLKMPDTSFFLPPAKRDRLATVYSANGRGGIARAPDGGTGQGDFVDGPGTCFSGGAGLLSTATDYGRFLQMLLNGGELDGVRVISPKFVELMSTNHVGSLYAEGNLGFGLGFEIVEHVGRAGRPGSVGAYGWGSAYYSTYWIDPQEKLVAIFFTQLLPATGVDLQDKFRYLVYQSIVGPPPPPAPSKPAARKKTTTTM